MDGGCAELQLSLQAFEEKPDEFGVFVAKVFDMCLSESAEVRSSDVA